MQRRNYGIPTVLRAIAQAPEAEERFKRIHAAYLALVRAFRESANSCRAKRNLLRRSTRIRQRQPFISGTRRVVLSRRISLTRSRSHRGARHVESSEPMWHLSNCRPGRARSFAIHSFNQPRMYIRDASGILSVVWYVDLGENQARRSARGEQGAWQRIAEKIAGNAQTLLAARSIAGHGSRFRALTDDPDDRVKKVVYNFLRQMKSNWQS